MLKHHKKLRKDLSFWKQVLSQILSNTLYNISCQRPPVAPVIQKALAGLSATTVQRSAVTGRSETAIRKYLSSQSDH